MTNSENTITPATNQDGKFVFAKDLAEDIGIDRSNVLKALKRYSIPTEERRDPSCNNARCTVLTIENAEAFKNIRLLEGYHVDGENIGEPAPKRNFVYVIQCDPEMRPNRIKVGITMDIISRLPAYKIVCPEVKVLRLWVAPPSCEGYLIALGQALGHRVGQELFDIGDTDEFFKIADIAFSPFESSMDTGGV